MGLAVKLFSSLKHVRFVELSLIIYALAKFFLRWGLGLDHRLGASSQALYAPGLSNCHGWIYARAFSPGLNSNLDTPMAASIQILYIAQRTA